MTTFVALLRGINVGKAKRIAMAELRALLSQLGYTEIATLLNSGNAVFSAKTGSAEQHATAITQAIATQLGLEVPVIVKSAAVLSQIVAENPIKLEAADHARFLAIFVQDPKTLVNVQTIAPLVSANEQFAIGQHAAFLLCGDGLLESKAGAALLGKTRGLVTTRNWATVLKLEALAIKAAN